ncbi:hypothetical protein PDIDSM_5723 [Penicillium digitatum]|nr:hypothetical protein PDIDSM_5723 [Penicillium digitatum]
MRIHVISLVVLAAAAAGLTVTSPRMGEKIDPDMPLTIKWQAVTTDPETFSIELVNQNVYPPTTTVVAEDIDTSKGSYTVKAKTFTDVDDGKGYQINFVSPTSGILAQSQQFRVTEPGEIASSASSSGKETSTALETSSALISFASTSDITSSALASSTTSSYLSSTATHSSISASTPTSSYYSTASSSISTPTTSSFMTSSSASASTSSIFSPSSPEESSTSLFYIYTFSVFFHYTNFLYYIHLCYPTHFFFHYHVFHIPYEIPTSSYLDFQIKHSFFHIPFYTHFHYPWLVKGGKRSTSVSTISSTSLSTATHSSTTSTTTRKTTSTTTSTATESATTTSNAAAIVMPPAGGLLLGLVALVL